MNVTENTLVSVKTVFVELFRTPKSSIENPSLRVKGHGGSMNRSFIVEIYAEDEFGQWATDEATGEQGDIDDARQCFWTCDDNECIWQSRPFKRSPSEETKRQRKRQKWIQKDRKSISW